MSAYTLKVRMAGVIFRCRGNTFKKNQSTRTFLFEPAMRMRRIKMRVIKQKMGAINPRILIPFLLSVGSAMALGLRSEEGRDEKRGEIRNIHY